MADGGAISLVGRSASVGLAADLCWIPLAEPVAVTVALAIPAGGAAATTSRFRQFALAYAAVDAGLPGTG